MYTIDSETYLIAPGLLAPPLVCVQFAKDNEDPKVVVMGVDPVREVLEYILRSGELIVGQNVAYDMLVFVTQYPDLLPLIYQVYIDNRVADTMIREKLKRIADGRFWRLRGNGWSLGTLAKRYGSAKDSKDPWRLRYSELWGIPFEQWPEDAQNYAVKDVTATRQVYLRQSTVAGSGKLAEPRKVMLLKEHGFDKAVWAVSPDEDHQVRAAWVMHNIGATGVRTDIDAIRRFEASERSAYEADKALLLGSGLVRVDGSRALNVARDRMEQIAVARGSKLKRTPKGNVQLDEEACLESGDVLLLAYQRYGSRKNLLTRIQALYKGVDGPINSYFDSLMETGRTSCSKGNGSANGYQLQNMRRVAGERECFVPREGNVFLACDYSTLELRTLAQCCLWGVGGSELAQVLCQGGDPHLDLGAETLDMDYEEALGIYKDLTHPQQEEVENARQVCKVANFGFPGGMSSSTFCSYARGYGIELTEVQAAMLQVRWFSRWGEMSAYFQWIRQKLPWLEGVRKGHKVKVTNIKQFVSGRARGNITYTVVCNGFFQGLAADLNKAAGFALLMACDLGELKGWKIWNFVHDEYILEGPEHDSARAAKVVERIMCEEGQKWVPDIPILAEATLMRRWSKKAKQVFNEQGDLVPWEPAQVQRAHCKVGSTAV